MNAAVSIALAWHALPLAAPLAPSLTAGTAGAAARELGTAPDGHPGFGSAVALADARRVFLSPGDGERALLASLSGLEAEIRILVVAEEVRTAAAGDFDLVPRRAPRTLAVLHEAWFAALEDPLPALAAGGPGARALARTASDVRFRLRAEVLRGIERELRELTGALGVMQASFDGYADLSEAELSLIARRADLAAARQRAVLLDLEALRADEPVEVDPALAGLAERARGARGDAPDRAAADAARASLAALARRVEEACRELAGRAADETVVVVSHVSPIKAAVAWALGVGPEVAWRMWVEDASVSRVDITADGPRLRWFNRAPVVS